MSRISAGFLGRCLLAGIGDESMGTAAALEAAHRAGSPVVHELLGNWARYENSTPGG